MLYVVTRSCLWSEDHQLAFDVTRVVGVASSFLQAKRLVEDDFNPEAGEGMSLNWGSRMIALVTEDDESCNDCYEITKVTPPTSNT